ncbi:MAG: hypothetical protein GY795_47500 [Desulfobacterales bacterium]|nr:hypothetical protein [Desulfobacterales bacterium]
MKKSDLTCRREITAFLLSLLLMALLLPAAKHYSQFMTVAVCILPAFCLFMLRTVIRLAGKGTDGLLISLAVPGILFIAGGQVFEFTVTLVISPDLKREANEYVRLLLDSGNSPFFAYLYSFMIVIVWAAVIKSILWIALIKHRSSIILNINRKNNIFQMFWAAVIALISSNITSWLDGMGWLGIEISHMFITSVGMIFPSLCVSLYAALIWKSYKKIYQSEITVKFRLYIISSVFTAIIVSALCFLFIMRYYTNRTVLKYTDVNLNYIAENNMMNRYAEIDDTIQMITSNPYLDRKQTNGADALWEYISYNTDEQKKEFVSSIRKTSEMLKFSEMLKPDDELAETVDSFSTEIIDKAWMYNVLFFLEKAFPYDGRVSGTVLFSENRVRNLLLYYHYSKIMAAKICSLNRQGKNSTAKELYLKTLHMSWMLFNGDSLLSQSAGLASLRILCRDDITDIGIFTENEKKHLNRVKENLLFLFKKTDTGMSRNFDKPIMLLRPVIFYYPDRYDKVMTVLEPHRDRNFIVPLYYEMLCNRETLCILDSNSGIYFPLRNDRRFKEVMGTISTEKRFFMKRALRYTDKNIENCKSENCRPMEQHECCIKSKSKFIFKTASEHNSKMLFWFLRPFIWYKTALFIYH